MTETGIYANDSSVSKRGLELHNEDHALERFPIGQNSKAEELEHRIELPLTDVGREQVGPEDEEVRQ